MAISFISNALGATTSTTSFSITLPVTQANDIIVLEFCHRGTGNGTIGGTYSGPAFTLKHSQLFASSAFSGKTYYSRATGNHTGQTVTGSGLTNSCAAIVTVYRGCATSGDPLADATVVGEENASANETQAQITTATNAAWVVLVVVNSPDLAVSTQSSTSPGTLTERAERLSTGGTDTSISHASAEKATAGVTGSLTWAQTDAASGSWAYALKPEVANPVVVTPGTIALVLTAFIPVVTATLNQLVTVGTLALSLTAFAPTVLTPRVSTPGTKALSITAFVPTVGVGVKATPGTVALVSTKFVPTVTATANQVATPGTVALVSTKFAPTTIATANVTAIPGTLASTIATFVPTVTAVAGEPDVICPNDVVCNFSLGQWRKWAWKGKELDEDTDDLPVEIRKVVIEAVKESVSASLIKDEREHLLAAMEAWETYNEAYKQAYKDAYIAESVKQRWFDDLRKEKRNRAITLLLLH